MTLDLNLLLLLRHRLEADRWQRLVSVEGGAVVVHHSVDVDGLIVVGVHRGSASCSWGQNADLKIKINLLTIAEIAFVCKVS